MYRKLFNDLAKWKNRTVRKPLVIRGARQVGKTFLVREFAKQYFSSFIEINFDRSPEKNQLFDSSDIERSLKLLEIDEDAAPIDKNTLLFFDEIQAAPDVFHFLRYLFEQRPDIPVIAASSLLEFLLEEHNFSMPVGRIEYLHMGPLDFEEFLMATGNDKLVSFLENYQLNDNIPESIHNKLLYFTQLFFIVGGMPAAVRDYSNGNNLSEAQREHQSIIQTYEDDFSKYRKKSDHKRLQKVFQKLPALIGNKLKYVNIDPNDRAKDLANSLELLEMAKIFYRVKHSSANGTPLRAEVDDKVFKPLFLDIGLASSSLGLKLTSLTNKNNNLMVDQGALTEQFIGQHLLYIHPYYEKPELFYWNREARNSSAEIDYLLTVQTIVVPVEVKAGKTGTLKSLQLFVANKSSTIALRFNTSPPVFLQQTTRLAHKKDCDYMFLSLPLYLVCQSVRLLDESMISK
ncbi:MAG: AAA family ATPase [Pseudomonadota bacterium]